MWLSVCALCVYVLVCVSVSMCVSMYICFCICVPLCLLFFNVFIKQSSSSFKSDLPYYFLRNTCASLAVVTHTFNPCTWEADAGGFL